MHNTIPDIYFDDNYGSLYEKIENGSKEIFTYQSKFGEIRSQFIKRMIPIQIDNKQYYDIVTPYGYGGPIMMKCIGNKEELLKGFESEFREYCRDNHIVSEFIRFHPIVGNALEFKDVYDISWDRYTLGTNLKEYDDPATAEFSKSCRKRIRRALKEGISYRITENPRDISSFQKVYFSTMDRNNANEYYYFSDDYFDMCQRLFGEQILLVEAIYDNTVIAAGFYFIWNKTIHIHLSGTLNEYLYLSPAYILRYAVTLWGKENGYEMIHHGGGRSNSPEDSLYTFKKQFGQNTAFDFFTGKKIWDESIYETLCKRRNKPYSTDGFFPKYRE